MKAIYNIPYGLFVITAKDEDKQNGCIANTLIQITSTPVKVSLTLNKDNLTTQIISKTKSFNASILDLSTNFALIQNFGFQSGRNTNKFENFKDYKIAKNNIYYINNHTNSYLSCKVVSQIDVGTHITFIAEVTEDVILSNTESLTYSYYLNNIKPKPEAKNKKAYVCRICGYVYEGDTLPEDFICPICGHGVSDFVLQESKINEDSNSKQKKYYCPICGNIEELSNGPVCEICKNNMQIVEI